MTSVPGFVLGTGVHDGGTVGAKARRMNCPVPTSQASMALREKRMIGEPAKWTVSFVFMIWKQK